MICLAIRGWWATRCECGAASDKWDGADRAHGSADRANPEEYPHGLPDKANGLPSNPKFPGAGAAALTAMRANKTT